MFDPAKKVLDLAVRTFTKVVQLVLYTYSDLKDRVENTVYLLKTESNYLGQKPLYVMQTLKGNREYLGNSKIVDEQQFEIAAFPRVYQGSQSFPHFQEIIPPESLRLRGVRLPLFLALSHQLNTKMFCGQLYHFNGQGRTTPSQLDLVIFVFLKNLCPGKNKAVRCEQLASVNKTRLKLRKKKQKNIYWTVSL